MKRRRVPIQHLPVFSRELYQLVKAGIPLEEEGLAMLRDDEEDPEIRSWLDSLCSSIEEGGRLASALRETKVFPGYMTDMVALAEETGRLEDVLLSLQRHYDRQLRMIADIRGAVAVPMTLFAVMVAVVALPVSLLTGAGVYRRVESRVEENAQARVSLNYLVTKIHAYDQAGMVKTGSFGDGEAVFLYEEMDGALYKTVLYIYDEELMEMFCLAEAEPAPEFGEGISPALDLSVSQPGKGLLRLSLTGPNGQAQSADIYVRSEG